MFGIFTTTKHSFEGQLPDEKTLAVIRMHWFSALYTGLMFLFVAGVFCAPIFFVELLPEIYRNMIWFLISVLFMFWWYWLFYFATMYYLNIWIITDHRIISSHQTGLFKRNLADLHLDKLQDISVNIEGFFETMLNFGEVEVQSAGAENKFRMSNVPDPIEVKDIITRAQSAYIRLHPEGAEEPGS